MPVEMTFIGWSGWAKENPCQPEYIHSPFLASLSAGIRWKPTWKRNTPLTLVRSWWPVVGLHSRNQGRLAQGNTLLTLSSVAPTQPLPSTEIPRIRLKRCFLTISTQFQFRSSQKKQFKGRMVKVFCFVLVLAFADLATSQAPTHLLSKLKCFLFSTPYSQKM